MAPLARTTGPLPWTAECLDGPCALGSLVADALCQWAASDHSAQPIVCLVPSRWLGAGLPGHRALEFESLSEVIPIHTLAFVRMEAGSLKSVPGAKDKWLHGSRVQRRHPWHHPGRCQVFGFLGLHAETMEATTSSRSCAQVVSWPTTQNCKSLRSSRRFRCSSAGSVPESRQVALSAQRALADYLRATSPLNASALAVQSRMRCAAG